MMGRALRYMLILCSMGTAIFFGVLWIERARMEYNSEGRYFDENSTLVFDEGGVLFFGMLTMLSLVIAGLALERSLRVMKRST